MFTKNFFKKLFIISIATVILEAIIVYFLYTSINAFYGDMSGKIAVLLTEQARDVITSGKFDITKLSQYNKYPVRRLLKRFSSEESEILHILLVDTSSRIIVSDIADLEGEEYSNPIHLQVANTTDPQIIGRKWEGDYEVVDVLLPLRNNQQIQGYLRTTISVKESEYFTKDRTTVLVLASIIAFGVILLTVFLTSRIYHSNLKAIRKAVENLGGSRHEGSPSGRANDQLRLSFSNIQKPLNKAADIDASFHEAEDQAKALMKVIHEGLVIFDMNMKIISYNDYLIEIFQLKKYLEPEKKIYQIFEQNSKLVEVYRRTKDPLMHNIRRALIIRLLNGNFINVQVNAMSIPGKKSPSGIILYFKNLGLLQELEENLHRSMKYSVISKLASSVGHEIRNPLSSLAIHTEIVDNLVSKSVTDEQQLKKIKKSVRVLHSEVDRLNKMIGQFFNLAKSEEIKLTCENTNNLLDEIADIINQQAREKNISIYKQFSDNLPMITVSKDQIKQVIINLILNSFDAMPEGGDLFLETSRNDGRVVISVKDSGIGIPDDVREHIFDLYYSTKPSGAGIGLAISRKIIEAHEGKIYFKSDPNKGTVFSIELPPS